MTKIGLPCKIIIGIALTCIIISMFIVYEHITITINTEEQEQLIFNIIETGAITETNSGKTSTGEEISLSGSVKLD